MLSVNREMTEPRNINSPEKRSTLGGSASCCITPEKYIIHDTNTITIEELNRMRYDEEGIEQGVVSVCTADDDIQAPSVVINMRQQLKSYVANNVKQDRMEDRNKTRLNNHAVEKLKLRSRNHGNVITDQGNIISNLSCEISII